MRKFLLAALAVVALVPSGAHAATMEYSAPYLTGPKGGDQYNYVSAEATTGRMSVFRLQPPIPNGGLGCAGRAGYATLEVRNITDPISSVTLAVDEAVWNSFAWVTLSILRTSGPNAGDFINTTKVRGPATISTVTLDIDEADRVGAGVSQTVRFGLEVSSSCTPAIDGGTALFSSVSVQTD